MLKRLFVLAVIVVLVAPRLAAGQEATPTPSPTWNPMNPTPRPLPAPTLRPGARLVEVPGGTIVAVSLGEPVSSATANLDDQVPIVVKKEVDVDGWVVVPAGAPGGGTVTSVDRAGGNGHGGKLGISIDWVFSSDGGKIALSNINHASDNGDQKGASSTATIASYLLLGPLGLFAHNFVHGKDVTIDTDKVFSVYVDHNVHVQASQKGVAPTGFDQ